MSTRQPSLFDSQRGGWEEALEVTAQSLVAYGASYRHWAIAFSGGKDSTATVSAVLHLIESGRVKRPESLTVLYADTRMELTPLHAAAMVTLDRLAERGFAVKRVLPELDKRFFVYMFGRGVPPPGSNFRWCTGLIKINPMQQALAEMRETIGEKFLVLTGVRVGESAARDARIVISCGKNGAECGQGWFQETTPAAVADTLAPLLHWRVCSVWDWLFFHAPRLTGLPTNLVAEAYGGDEAAEINARTGCVGCAVASHDRALEAVIENPKWVYLAPLMKLRQLWDELKKPALRIRKDGTETKANGELVRNPCRMGPLTFEGRRWGLAQVLAIQNEVNALAGEMPHVILIDAEEEARIHELIAANTWPCGWDGTEQLASLPYEKVNPDGSAQPFMEALLR